MCYFANTVTVLITMIKFCYLIADGILFCIFRRPYSLSHKMSINASGIFSDYKRLLASRSSGWWQHCFDIIENNLMHHYLYFWGLVIPKGYDHDQILYCLIFNNSKKCLFCALKLVLCGFDRGCLVHRWYGLVSYLLWHFECMLHVFYSLEYKSSYYGESWKSIIDM